MLYFIWGHRDKWAWGICSAPRTILVAISLKALIWYRDIEPMIAQIIYCWLANELLPFLCFVSSLIMILIGCIVAHPYCSSWFVPSYTDALLLLRLSMGSCWLVFGVSHCLSCWRRIHPEIHIYLDSTLLLHLSSHLATCQSFGSSMEEVLPIGFIPS